MLRYWLALVTAGAAALAQAPAPPSIVSPEVHADKRVTFRFRAPNAREVMLTRAGSAPLPMQKSANGVWTVTTDPLPPDYYLYTFTADGVSLLDPLNSAIKPNLLNPSSIVHVPGEGLPWEIAGVPRGAIQHRFYRSKIVGDHRDYYVYTPPGYDAAAKKQYPVLYLLHGFSDDAQAWTTGGLAHVILDNLIAQGKATPMLIVMTLGYGDLALVSRTGPGFRSPETRQRSFDRFRDSVLQEVIPQVEKDYRVAKDRTKRAIAGLSMGGAETLYIGLNNLDRFAWVAAFSAGGLGDNMPAQFPKLDASANKLLRLFWISCGLDDRLIEANRKYIEFFNSKGVEVKLREGPGAHTWMVWRRDLAALAPLLFK